MNRWWIAVAGFCMQMALGAGYAWSVFRIPLVKEFGWSISGDLLLADEVLTPDSSRFWPADKYQPGRAQESYDKQYVRDYLESIHWEKKPPAPGLPPEVQANTSAKYVEAYRQLTGRELPE